jgi:hypothetical protein
MKSAKLKTEEATMKKLVADQKIVDKEIKLKEKEALKKEKDLEKIVKEIQKQEDKLSKKKKAPVEEYTPMDRPWTISVVGECECLSGSKPKDIDPMINKPKTDVEKLRLNMLAKQVEILQKTSKPSVEDMNSVSQSINSYQEEVAIYSCNLMSIWRDNQRFGRDNLPLPCIPQHFIPGAINNAIQISFGDALGIWTRATPSPGWAQIDQVSKHFKVFPRHIFMYRDLSFDPKSIVTASEIYIEGQQPTPTVRGFAKDEVLDGPLYFKFTLKIIPSKTLPNLTNRRLVADILDFAASFGLGGRRTANYGMWKILDVKVGEERETLYDKFFKEEGERKAA